MKNITSQKDRAAALWRAPRENEEKFYVDAPFTREVFTKDAGEFKIGDIETNGYASTWVKDRDEEYVHPSAFDNSLPKFVETNPMMLWQHNMDWPLGKFLEGTTDTFGLKTRGVVPKVFPEEPDWKHLAYHSIARGIVKTHSIGGYFTKMWDEERTWIMEVDLMEISIVTVPANPESVFEAAVKSVAGGSRRPVLTESHISQMSQILGSAAMTDPLLLAMNDAQRREHYDRLAKHYEVCGKTPPEYEEWHELVKDTMSSKGLDAVAPQATKAIAFTQKVRGHTVSIKTGRRLSSKNEDRLQQAVGLIGEVLDSIDAEDEDASD